VPPEPDEGPPLPTFAGVQWREFVGLVSLRDMVALMMEEKEKLISRVKEYITS